MLFVLRFLLIFILLTTFSGQSVAQIQDRYGIQNRGGLNDRIRQCRAGQLKCGARCCSPGQRCSFDGHCIRPGGTYCGGGRSCGPFERCVSGGARCAPAGANKCTSRLDCPGGSFCNGRGECERVSPGRNTDSVVPSRPMVCDDGRTCASGTACLPGGGCTQPGWFLCEETGSQCRNGFKCSQHEGCVPVKAVDCGNAKWCKPGEQCLPGGGCEKLPEGSDP